MTIKIHRLVVILLCVDGQYSRSLPISNHLSLGVDLIVGIDLIKKLHRLFNDNDVQFYCCSYDRLDLGDEQRLLYLDPSYYNTFDKYTSDGFN